MVAGDSLQGRATDRNRVNQRNFRARRQAYIHELEQRLQKLETDEVRVTKEVQVAAQRVDNENRHLRRLLSTRFQVSDPQINQYLAEMNSATDAYTRGFRRRVDKNHASPESEESVSSAIYLPVAEKALKTKPSHDPTYTESISIQEDRLGGLEGVSQFGEHDSRSVIVSPPATEAPQSRHVDSHLRLPRARSPIEYPSPEELGAYDNGPEHGLSFSCHSRFTKDAAVRDSSLSAKPADTAGTYTGETSCVEAANIIASLRGRNVDEDVWSELGCNAKQSCRVKNISVFELMDKT